MGSARDTTDRARRKALEKLTRDLNSDPRVQRALGGKRPNSETAHRLARELADKTQKQHDEG